IFVPAFPEGGRHTIGGIHYLDMAGLRTPAAHTEFARDPLFGYRSIRIDDWAREVGDDRPLVLLDLDDVRRGGPEVIADRLLAAGDGALFLPDAETVADVAVI